MSTHGIVCLVHGCVRERMRQFLMRPSLLLLRKLGLALGSDPTFPVRQCGCRISRCARELLDGVGLIRVCLIDLPCHAPLKPLRVVAVEGMEGVLVQEGDQLKKIDPRNFWNFSMWIAA